MFGNKNSSNKNSVYQNKALLTKFKSSYDKLEREMNKPPSDYESIKTLVEETPRQRLASFATNNSIANIQQKNINIKSGNNINLKSHNRIKKY